jgi:hypothetical protein
MKKIYFVLIMAAAVLLLLPLTGCPSELSDLSWGGPAVGDVVGDMNEDGLVLSSTGAAGVYKTETFTYANDMTAWSGGNGTINCKIRAKAGDWATSYGAGGQPTIGGEFVKADGGDNFTVSGFAEGSNYHFEVKSTRELGVMIKVVKE